MATGDLAEGSFPDTAENLESNAKQTLVKQAAMWFRIHGLLDRILTAVKHLASLISQHAALTSRMENRSTRGPEDFAQERGSHYGGYYGGDQGPAPSREPTWQNSLLGKLASALIMLGIPAILATLWNMSSQLADLKGDNRLVVQRQDAMEKHLEATDRDVAEIKRELWPHKH